MAIANAITFVLIQPKLTDIQRYGYDFVIFKMTPLLLSLCITEWVYLFNPTMKNDLPSMLYKSVFFYCTFAFAILPPYESGFFCRSVYIEIHQSTDSH